MKNDMDKASTSAIWEQFSGRLKSFIAKRVRDEDAAEDVFQDVFAKIHERLVQVELTEKLEPWLFQVTRRSIIDHFRRQSPARRPKALPLDLEAERPSPKATAELAACLRPMVDELPHEDQEALRLSDEEGLPQRELADRLGLSLSGAKSRVQRARKRLKGMLLGCCRVELDRRGNVADYALRRPCDSCACR
jgi:RNA polymerase sigma-70 factor (ECF subfamily)